MNCGRIARLLLTGLLCLSFPAHAVSRIDIRIGEVRHPAALIKNVSVTMDKHGRWHGKAGSAQGVFDQLAKELALPVTLNKGTVDGHAEFAGVDTQLQRVKISANVRDVAFSDVAGLHAGEKVGGRISLDAENSSEGWKWRGELDWQHGEVFWQPLYFPAGGHVLKARGVLASGVMEVEEGSLLLRGIGQVAFHGRYHLNDKVAAQLDFSAKGLQAGQGYELLAKPFLDKTALGNLEAAGQVDIQGRLAGGELQTLRLALNDFDMADKNGQFAFYKVKADVPWMLKSPTRASLHFEGGHVLNISLGRTDLSAGLDGWLLSIPEGQVPLLDGVLALRNVYLARVDGEWEGHLGARLSPVSMAEFSHAMGWPRMEGKLEVSAPLATYAGGRLNTDGEIKLGVFDGTITLADLSLQNLLGLAPRLNTDIRMRNLDLDLLTHTFSFGTMSGRLDGDVENLELSSWKPVKFDANFRSSPGSYPKKISQRAVQNISALGGAGASAAIQRSFLRFLENFNYGKIGLSCRLRNGVCAMDGLEPAQSGYVIVKGSGIPAITVLGYNRSVSWGELLSRLQRITEGNVQPVIR